MTAPRYALGALALIAVSGSLAVAAVGLRRRFAPSSRGAIARLIEIVLGLGLLVGVLEVLGAVGLFRLGPIVVACVLLAAISRPAFGGLQRGSLPSGVMAAALVLAAAVIAEWAVPTLESYDFGVRTFDSLWYHLPWAASYAQTGQITPLRFTDVEYLTAFYPATSELFHSLGIVAFGRDLLSPALNLVWLGLVLLAGYCVGLARGVGAVTMAGTALAMATPMVRFSQAGSAANDVVAVFFLLAAVALLLHAGEERFPLVLAAIAAGLAVGVKLTVLAPVLALSVAAIVLWPRRAGAWAVPLVLAGGFWYLRNLIAVGNPVPWVSVPLLTTPAPPLQQHTAFSVAHYLFGGHLVDDVFRSGLASGLGPWWLVVLAVALAAPLSCLLPGADRIVRALGLVALAAWIAYVLTPETAAGPAGSPLGFAFNLRYALPALALSLTIAPLAPALVRGRAPVVLLGVFAVVLLATLAQSRLWAAGYVPAAVAVAIGVFALAAAVVWRPLVAVALAAAVAVLGGYFGERHYLRVRYAYQPQISSLARVWSYFRGVHHARVGVVGTFGGFFSYPLFGLDLSNSVEYVGRRGAHGSFTPIGSCAAWRASLNAGHFRYVVTTPARDPWHPSALTFSPEGGWTAGDPAARLAYGYRALGQPIAVYELRGRLDPSTCPHG